MKHQLMVPETPQGLVSAIENNNTNNSYSCSQEKKKRLTSDQLDSLERSFQEEIKLDPDRKMKLSRDLGLQPRQIAVWFQNRRARWKAKQLERLYDALKQEFDVMFKEKQKLQEEVAIYIYIYSLFSSCRPCIKHLLYIYFYTHTYIQITYVHIRGIHSGDEIESLAKRTGREEANIGRLHRNFRGRDSREHIGGGGDSQVKQVTRNEPDCRVQLSVQCGRV